MAITGNASPPGDASPVLLALNASLLLQSGEQQRNLPLYPFFTGYYQTQLEKGEVMSAIHIDKVTVSPDFAA